MSVTKSVTKTPPGPWSWPWDEDKVGRNVQDIYNFLDDLWKPNSPLRDQLRAITSGKDLKSFVKTNLSIDIPPDVNMILVDIEDANTTSYGTAIDPTKDPFYVLIIPPTPRRHKNKEYKDAQAWSEAWFHATTDGLGM
jgi:hypothetical protein